MGLNHITQKHSLLDEFLSKNHFSERELNKSSKLSMTDFEFRKSTGSFYTPTDVTNFVWQIVLDEIDGDTIFTKLRHFINNYEQKNYSPLFIY